MYTLSRHSYEDNYGKGGNKAKINIYINKKWRENQIKTFLFSLFYRKLVLLQRAIQPYQDAFKILPLAVWNLLITCRVI